ncbi:MAG: hypothetical protein OXI96_08850 [Acidimicrobiaceae bacterium]|nr:hypothetical protein [Acidimicrobiaceae bacterium]
MQDKPDEELVELIIKRVYECIDIRPDQAQVLATLQGTPMPHSVPTTPARPADPGQVHPTTTAGEDHSVPTASVQPAAPRPPSPRRSKRILKGARLPRPDEIRILGEVRAVELWTDVVREVASSLYELHPTKYDQTLLNLWPNRKSAVALESEHIHRPFCPPGANVYLTTNGDALSLCRKAGELLEAFGHDRDDLKIHTANQWYSNTDVIKTLSKR